jgi:hypothetical protein
MSKTLIITSAVGYDQEQAQNSPFMLSLARYTNDEDTKIEVVTSVPEEYENAPVQSWWRFVAKDRMEDLDPEQYERVILTDFRDVIFQGDPAEIPAPANGVMCFYEDSRMTIGSCSYNSLWIQRDYGMDTLEKYRNRLISCCGVVVGDQAGMLQYLQATTEEIKKIGKWDLGVDTSVHNMLMWENRFNHQTMQNENPWVYTVGHCLSIRVARKQILNRKGQIPIMVHQYDRHV